MEQERKTVQFMIRMRPSVKEAADKAAAQENRSLASFVETLLIQVLEQKGFLRREESSTPILHKPVRVYKGRSSRRRG